jgi:hypothetical protein
MLRERALKVVLVVVGLLFTAGVYPLIGSLLHPADSDTGDTMMLSLYVALGVFLLIAVRNPSAHRSLIAFRSVVKLRPCRGNVDTGTRNRQPAGRVSGGSAVLVVIGVALIVLAPARSIERVSAAVA